MASTKRKPDMHWGRPAADVLRKRRKYRDTEDVVMHYGEDTTLNRETARQTAAAVAALTAGYTAVTDSLALVWRVARDHAEHAGCSRIGCAGVPVRDWVNATDATAGDTGGACACTTDRASAADAVLRAAAGERTGRIAGWRAAVRARRAEVARDAVDCFRRTAGATWEDAGVWGVALDSWETLRLMGVHIQDAGEWSRQGTPEARAAERANSVEPVTVRAADGSVRVYIPDVSVSPIRANVTRRMTRAAERGTAEAAEARAAHAEREAARRARLASPERRAAEAARKAAKRAERAAMVQQTRDETARAAYRGRPGERWDRVRE